MKPPAAAKRALVAAAAAIALAACGARSPEAPLGQAKKLSVSTSGISTACGLAYQATAFPGNHRRELATLDVAASSSAVKLASVYRRNPGWLYQGATVSEIVSDGIEMLRACGLHRAARTLSAAASRRGSETSR
jgi:hypothetical protein